MGGHGRHSLWCPRAHYRPRTNGRQHAAAANFFASDRWFLLEASGLHESITLIQAKKNFPPFWSEVEGGLTSHSAYAVSGCFQVDPSTQFWAMPCFLS